MQEQEEYEQDAYQESQNSYDASKSQEEAPAEAGPPSETDPVKEWTQRYLELRSSGKLLQQMVTKINHNTRVAAAPVTSATGSRSPRNNSKSTRQQQQSGSGSVSGDADQQQLQGTSPATESVYAQQLARLQAATQDLEVEPVKRHSGNNTSRSPRGQQDQNTSSAPPSPGADNPTRPQRSMSAGPSRVPGSPRALQRTHSGKHNYTLNPFRKLYTPGPGSYQPSTTRFGTWKNGSTTFGTARQRPPHVCIHDNVVSPGPVYQPGDSFSSKSTGLSKYKFGGSEMGTRYDYDAMQPSNCPHWNPGPGQYSVHAIAKGGTTIPGSDAPKYKFGRTAKMIRPEDRFSATVFLSNEHASRENVTVHSPGPAAYSPGTSPVKERAAAYSLSLKAPSYFDVFLDPGRQTSPGPIYQTAGTNGRGTKTWGNDPRATFGFAQRSWDPELNLSKAAFISTEHAKHANPSVHSPGPVYLPKDAKERRVPAPTLSSGQFDRFYDRFELGRIQ